MIEILLNNIDMLKIKKDDYNYSGASQQWYLEQWQRQAGCGPTTATNQLIYLAKTQPEAKNLFKQTIDAPNVLQTMEKVWNYITPSALGVNRLDILASGGLAYAKSNNVELNVQELEVPMLKNNRPTLADVKEFIKIALEKSLPIAYLNLGAGKLDNLSSWHWVLIVGAKISDKQLIVTVFDEGMNKEIDLGLWLKTSLIGGGFVTFSI